MKKSFVRTAIAATLMAGAALAAQAQTVTITGWTFGTGNGVTSTWPGGAEVGLAGGFDATAAGIAGLPDGSFQTYCVDLAQTFFGPPSAALTGYSLISGASNTTAFAAGGWGVNAATITANLGKLLGYVASSAGLVDTSTESTSLQLAIWNTIYDTDSTVASGAFSDTSPYAAYATALLTGAASFSGSSVALQVLHSDTNQDFLVTTPVPEPSTYALMLAGLAGVGFVARRRARR